MLWKKKKESQAKEMRVQNRRVQRAGCIIKQAKQANFIKKVTIEPNPEGGI